jgi:3-carboxy-cis,cis-muconate cycloisomerase
MPSAVVRTRGGPLLLLERVFGDPVMADIFSEIRTVESWLAAERALASAQARAGVLSQEVAQSIAAIAVVDEVDRQRLWLETANVGYPILPLVQMLSEKLPVGPSGRLHYGATTQDIMDTGLVLQLRDALARLSELLEEFGNRVAELVARHRATVMAARTHGQQAVPTTFGAKLSVLLAELIEHEQRLAEIRPRVLCVSLHGAGGTSAALGTEARVVRTYMANALGLGSSDVPWHVNRSRIAEFGQICSSLAATCARFGREVIDLSRTEIGEVRERSDPLRGASSTMPQKANPIGSEVVVGMASVTAALSSALYRAMEAGAERSAGEWQIEWQVIPQVAVGAATCLMVSTDIAAGLQVFPNQMRANLTADGGLIMAEAVMMKAAERLGKTKAHALVYEAARRARANNETLGDVLCELADTVDIRAEDLTLTPEEYLGDAFVSCDAALQGWREKR